jgi:hypothetical protein|tara:strand:+ start:899 stop:1147 length:249 start_codon:yes stop_codon:yes gene_type:complete
MENSMYEQTIAIPIQKTSSFENKELSLNTTSIDPTTMSPPNNFMNKLVKRMGNYYSPTSAPLSRPTSPFTATSMSNTFSFNK